jgi:hypothetical protein
MPAIDGEVIASFALKPASTSSEQQEQNDD